MFEITTTVTASFPNTKVFSVGSIKDCRVWKSSVKIRAKGNWQVHSVCLCLSHKRVIHGWRFITGFYGSFSASTSTLGFLAPSRECLLVTDYVTERVSHPHGVVTSSAAIVWTPHRSKASPNTELGMTATIWTTTTNQRLTTTNQQRLKANCFSKG